MTLSRVATASLDDLEPRESEVLEGEVLDPEDPHGLLVETYPAGPHRIAVAHLSCRCGEWEAIVTGLGSSRWAIDEHTDHRAAVAAP